MVNDSIPGISCLKCQITSASKYKCNYANHTYIHSFAEMIPFQEIRFGKYQFTCESKYKCNYYTNDMYMRSFIDNSVNEWFTNMIVKF